MCLILRAAVLAAFLTAASTGPALAAPATVDTGHVAWVLTSSGLVLFMTLPGLALFYGGLVQAKNVLSVVMHCFAICCIASVLWVAFGYTLAFSDGTPWLGSLAKALLTQLDAVRPQTSLPENVFALFQMTFAIITPALIVGAFPERIRFPFVALFSAAWLMLVYVPVAHWMWGGGWLATLGALDFAGGVVVHTTAGVSALVVALLVGPRRGFPNALTPPHSPGMTMAGAGMLWVGWFGFNGGSALAADASAASAMIATQLAASAGALVWMAAEWIKIRKPTSIGIVTGCVAGLATVTPAAGYVGPAGAMVLGALGGGVCFGATLLVKQRFRVDDTLDVFAVHGVGGMLGSLLLAFLALPALGGSGLPEGASPAAQLGLQALAVAAVALWSGLATVAITKLVGAVTGVRADAEEEFDGLDLATHGERAYEFT
jgi:Amt family ammonium transporter